MRIEERAYRYQSLVGEGVRASCRDVNCDAWRLGWTSTLDESTVPGKLLADRVRAMRGYHFTETHEGDLTVFVFAPGQACGQDHEIRPGIFLERIGPDRPQVMEGERWIDRFHEHTDRLTQLRNEG